MNYATSRPTPKILKIKNLVKLLGWIIIIDFKVVFTIYISYPKKALHFVKKIYN